MTSQIQIWTQRHSTAWTRSLINKIMHDVIIQKTGFFDLFVRLLKMMSFYDGASILLFILFFIIFMTRTIEREVVKSRTIYHRTKRHGLTLQPANERQRLYGVKMSILPTQCRSKWVTRSVTRRRLRGQRSIRSWSVVSIGEKLTNNQGFV